MILMEIWNWTEFELVRSNCIWKHSSTNDNNWPMNEILYLSVKEYYLKKN